MRVPERDRNARIMLRPSPIVAIAGRRQERADRTRGSTLLTDHLAEIGARDAQLEDRLIPVLAGFDLDLVGVVDETAHDQLDEFGHALAVVRA